MANVLTGQISDKIERPKKRRFREFIRSNVFDTRYLRSEILNADYVKKIKMQNAITTKHNFHIENKNKKMPSHLLVYTYS